MKKEDLKVFKKIYGIDNDVADYYRALGLKLDEVNDLTIKRNYKRILEYCHKMKEDYLENGFITKYFDEENKDTIPEIVYEDLSEIYYSSEENFLENIKIFEYLLKLGINDLNNIQKRRIYDKEYIKYYEDNYEEIIDEYYESNDTNMILDELKEIHDEVISEEGKDRKIKNRLRKYTRKSKKIDELIKKTIKGETKFYLNKLKSKDIKENKIKYIISNRRTIALSIGLITLGGILITNNNQKSIKETSNVTEVVDENNNQLPQYIVINQYYTIKAGDTLSELSEEFGCNQNEITYADDEKISNNNMIQIGDVLKYKVRIPNEDIDEYVTSYSIEKNESLETIATIFNTDVESLIKINEENIIENNNDYIILNNIINVPNISKNHEKNNNL